MPKRLIDADAVWASSRLATCSEWTIPEYTWLYGLADCNGSFELTDLRVIHGKVAAIRPHYTVDMLRLALHEFRDHGLLFVWRMKEKIYGHWTNSDKDHRLPPVSERNRYRAFAPPVPQQLLLRYLAKFKAQKSAQLGFGSIKTTGGSSLAQAKPRLAQAKPLEAQVAQSTETAIVKTGSNSRLGLGVGLGVGIQTPLPISGSNGSETPEPRPDGAPGGTLVLQAPDFDEFWEAYPKKVGKLKARKAWNKTKCDGHMKRILESLAAWKKTLQWSDRQYIPYPASWLNQEFWKETPPQESTHATGKRNTSARNAVNSGQAIERNPARVFHMQ